MIERVLMTNKEKRCYLQQYTELDKIINQKMHEYERIKSIAEKCTSLVSGMPRGGSYDRTDIYIRLTELNDEINNMIDMYVDMGREIEGAISTVQNETLRDLLIHRYMRGLKWERVAEEIGQTVPMTKIKLHGRALNALNLNTQYVVPVLDG